MSELREAVRLDSPAGDVWAFVTDPANFPLYVNGYAGGQVETAERFGIGARYRWMAHLGPWTLHAVEEVTGWVQGSRVEYEGSIAGVPFRSWMAVAPEGEGSVLSIGVNYDLPPRRGGALTAVALSRTVRRAMRRSLAVVERRFAPAEKIELERVAHVYGFWGRNPVLYAAQDFVTFMGRPGRVRGAAVDALGLAPGAGVLEVACGTGRNFAHIQRAIGPAGRLTGFDFSSEMLEAAGTLCRRRGWTNVRLVQGDAAALDTGETDYDGVLSVLGMSAIPAWREAIARCRARLRPGGVLVVCDARLLPPPLSVLNPAVRKVYGRLAAWEPERDIPGAMLEIFGTVEVQTLNAGTMFIARAVAP
ncbi:MAG: methyltransferase domain-containing protein [Deltaproteobacteria bacterium]|nr:methyltransferase domain-containing protein [Deltaproteobacteria bacterium]